VRFAVDDAVELEGRVTTEHESVDRRSEYRGCLEPSKQEHHLYRAEGCGGLDSGILVHMGRQYDRLDPRGAERGESSRRGGREVKAYG